MKRSITLGIFLLFTALSFGQKLDYDNDSKWFFGFNAGGTWNTTDVKNKTNLGWGLILGRSFNYNYGKKMSFDLRLRYLGGNWYGQDYDTTNVTGNSLYPDGGVIKDHYDTLGYTINNFNTEAHELGLELVLHINSLREKTGWDPYIFGGVGLAWAKTYTDLYSQDSLDANNAFYPYSANGMTKAEWNALSDDAYDTQLVGNNGKYRLNVVPNIGIGLAYQVGPKFSIGLEHRTMFYLQNDFDGFAGTSTKWGMKNDIYHYSGLSLKFHIGRGKTYTDVNNNTNTNTNNLNGGGGCKTPVVTIRKPNDGSASSSIREYNFEATVSNVAGRDNIHLYVNGSETTNFTFNPSSGKLESKILLNDGFNRVRLEASNACGDDQKLARIEYTNCIQPQVQFTNPSAGTMTVSTPTFTVNASVSNATSVEYQINGMNSSNFFLNGNNFSSTTALRPGANTLRIFARNECGTDEQTVTINYSDCTAPVVSILSGTGTIRVTEPVYNVQASVANVDGKSNIQFTINGVNKDFSYNTSTRTMKGNATLSPGINTIVITATNACGTNSATVRVEYAPCVPPTVNFIDPAGASVTVNTNTYQIKAQVDKVTSASQIQLKVNGIVRIGGSLNPTTHVFTHSVSLNDGLNTIEISATNECGSGNATAKITKRACLGPQIAMVQPAGPVMTVQSGTLAFSAKVFNISNASQLKLFVNGMTVLGGSYNAGTKMFTHSINLKEGANAIKLVATNDCSSQEVTYTVTYTPCVAPVITMLAPTAPTTSEVGTYEVQAIVTNVTSANQIQLKVNGTVLSGGMFDPSTGLYKHTINLSEGNNAMSLSADNGCGTDMKRGSVKYAPCVPPTLAMISPTAATISSTDGNVQVQATIGNVNASQIQLTVNGVVKTGGTYNTSSGLYQHNFTVSDAVSTVVITATTDCGTVSHSFVVKHSPCQPPTIAMISPRATTVTSETGSVQVKATIRNANASQIQLTVNGVVKPGGTYNASTGLYQHNITVSDAVSAVAINVTTDCGSVSHSFTVRHSPCNPPVINIIAPTTMTTTSATVLLQATVFNVTKASQISLTVNGSQVTGASFNATTGIYEKAVPLNMGNNAITIMAINDCGKEQKDLDVNRGEEQQITICHYPPGNTGNPQQIEIPLSAWPAHQAHGDVLGPCPTTNNSGNPNTGTGIGIGGSGGSTGGTVTGGGSDPGSGGGEEGGGEEGGGDNKSGDDDGGKSKIEKPGEIKPADVKPKEGDGSKKDGK